MENVMTEKYFGHFLDFSLPFIMAAQNVFETMIFTKIELQRPDIKKKPISVGDINTIMDISGMVKEGESETKFKGKLIISFPLSTYLKIASAMLSEEYNELNNDIMDVGAEINNMITGAAKKGLNNIGHYIRMSTPTTVYGKGVTLKSEPPSTVITIPVLTAYGPFTLELCYAEGPKLNIQTR